MKPKSLADEYNPYDFANPVTDAKLFAGRDDELAEIGYYLRNATKAPHPTHLALIGPRASGKTSLLNIAEREATKLSMLTSRLNLDISDLDSQFQFFYKFFNAILLAAVQAGAFGGIEGRTYDLYLEMTTTGRVPDDRTFCPFLFPIQYARSLSAGQLNNPVLDANLQRDLQLVSSVAGQVMVILIDECDVLQKHQAILQKIRNLFMSTRGYMLVLAGTPQLFPVFDDVFSPIIRQFKKLAVGSFASERQTRECIELPLKSLGRKVEALVAADAYSEIHKVSAGKPYEIQLICHVLFRRVQERNAPLMRLTIAVLEDVRRELETSGDAAGRVLYAAIKRLGRQELLALRLFTMCSGRLTFDQIWETEYTFKGETTWTKGELEHQLRVLEQWGLLRREKDMVFFAGDDVDALYVKYFSEEMGIRLRVNAAVPELWWRRRLVEWGRRHGLKALRPVDVAEVRLDLSQVGEVFAALPGQKDVFEDRDVEALYWALFEHRDQEKLSCVLIRLRLPWLRVAGLFVVDPAVNEWQSNGGEQVRELTERIEACGGEMVTQREDILVPNEEFLREHVLRTENAALRRRIGERHAERALETYVDNDSGDAYVSDALLAAAFVGGPRPSVFNNLAYMLMAAGKREEAERMIRECLSRDYTEVSGGVLPRYNQALLDLMRGDLEKSRTSLAALSGDVQTLSDAERGVLCLFVPIVEGNVVSLQEELDPNLAEVINRASAALDHLDGEVRFDKILRAPTGDADVDDVGRERGFSRFLEVLRLSGAVGEDDEGTMLEQLVKDSVLSGRDPM